MEKELEQEAVQTFATAPEIYQQAFKNAGADFPDELVTEIKKDPNQAVNLLNSDKNLKNAVINIYKSNKDAIVKYIQQAKSMFKKGGKFDYLEKLQQGGSLQGDIKPRGIKGLFFEATKYPRQDNQPGYISEYVTPAGDTTTVVGGRWNSWQRIARNGQKPEYQIAIGSDTYKPTFDPEAIEMLNNVHSRFTYPVKEQEGGRLTRRQMFEQASTNRGFSRSDAKKAFRNARNSGLNRQEAMRAVVTPETTTTVSKRPQLLDNIETPIGQITTTQETISAIPTRNYDNVDFGVFNFGNAFNKARNYGLNEFNWKGNRYTTELANTVSTPAEPSEKPIVNVFQKAVAPIVEDIRWNNEHRPYWADLKKQGGKLAKENEINKKYIKDSEKAGAKASKKMSDLKAKHKKEISKLKKK